MLLQIGRLTREMNSKGRDVYFHPASSSSGYDHMSCWRLLASVVVLKRHPTCRIFNNNVCVVSAVVVCLKAGAHMAKRTQGQVLLCGHCDWCRNWHRISALLEGLGVFLVSASHQRYLEQRAVCTQDRWETGPISFVVPHTCSARWAIVHHRGLEAFLASDMTSLAVPRNVVQYHVLSVNWGTVAH